MYLNVMYVTEQRSSSPSSFLFHKTFLKLHNKTCCKQKQSNHKKSTQLIFHNPGLQEPINAAPTCEATFFTP